MLIKQENFKYGINISAIEIQIKEENKFKYVRKRSLVSGSESFDLLLDGSVVFDIGIISDTSSSVSEELLVDSLQ